MVLPDPAFRALADSTRREILELLARGGRAVREIAERFPMSRPAISKHLRLLREAGLVTEARRGRERIYALAADGLTPAGEWLERVRAGGGPESGTAGVGDESSAPPPEEELPRRRGEVGPEGQVEAPDGESGDWRIW